MSDLITLTATDGTEITFHTEVKAAGGMKDVYFSPDKTFVVAFYREDCTEEIRQRLEAITGLYRERIFNQAGGDYWKNIFCWPSKIVLYKNKIGVVVPFYSQDFYFKFGSKNGDMLGIKGREKEGKWFTSPSNRNKYLDQREIGTWLCQLRICILIARGVRRLHAAGLAHSDLSYKNILVDPTTGKACLIDLDGLVVPGKFSPDVVGTPDFIAPECVMTAHLKKDDPNRKLPSIATDEHALATLIYLYLLLRHPLRGDQIHDSQDAARDETLAMGAYALFIEHPVNPSNRINLNTIQDAELPWKNTQTLPYSITGPYLSTLFETAFVDGLHQPSLRPTASEWETALLKTADEIIPCSNPNCRQKWYVFDNSTAPACPFCATPYAQKLAVINFYSSYEPGKFTADNHRLAAFTNQSLYRWHSNRDTRPNEMLSQEQKMRLGYIVNHNNALHLVNERYEHLYDVAKKIAIPVGDSIILDEGTTLLFSKRHDGRLGVVQLI